MPNTIAKQETNKKWFQTLARCRFGGGAWHLEAPLDGERLAELQYEQLLEDIAMRIREGAQWFNAACEEERKLHLVDALGSGATQTDPSGQRAASQTGGQSLIMAVFLDALQVKVSADWAQYRVVTAALAVRDFKEQNQQLRVFSPRMDHFGMLFWFDGQGQRYTADMIVQAVFQDLIQIADEADYANPSRKRSTPHAHRIPKT